MRRWLRQTLMLVLAWGPALAWAAELRVAVAANFMAPMQRLATAFERDTGHRVELAFGSTGRLYAQIRNGAPFDVLLAADEETPARLEKDGLAVAGTRQTYAVGRLVLWSLQPGRVDAQGEVLRRGGSAAQDHLAIADPKLAPYGRAALQTLESLGLSQLWLPRLVRGESIAQAHQFVASGNAALGLVAMSQVMGGGPLQGSAWVVPAHLHAPIRQDAVLLKRGQGKPAAAAFLAYLKTESARSIVRRAGYEL
jgi:molybdate transport system substrate-binding protein